MRKKSVIIGLAAVAAAYIAYPYFSLWRLGVALENKDAAALESKIEWPSVRQGLKDDFNALFMTQMAASMKDQEDNAAFAALGMALGGAIVNQMIDSIVTPQGIAILFQGDRPELPTPMRPGSGETITATAKPAMDQNDRKSRGPDIVWAFFEGPTSFRASLRGPNQPEHEKPLDIRMELVGGVWKLTRIMLPPEAILKQ